MGFSSKNLRADRFNSFVAVLGLGDGDPQPELELRQTNSDGRARREPGDDRVAQKIDEEA